MSPQSNSEQRVSLVWLWFGVLAPPFAWSAHELLSYMVASSACRLRGAGLAGEQARALGPAFVAIAVVTLVIALAGAWVAVRNWQRAREEKRDSSLDVAEIGAERTRFLARCGVINAAVFLTAFFFTAADMVVAPLCAG